MENINEKNADLSSDNTFHMLTGTIKVTGKDLLKRAVDLVYRNGGNSSLTEECLKGNVPSLIRYRQMSELFDIFNIKTDFMNFCNGKFIINRDEEDYRDLLASMIPEQDSARTQNKKRVLKEAFALLFSYKCAAMTLLNHTKRILAGGLGTAIAYGVIKKANKAIEIQTEEIDNILWEIIDPRKKTVTVSPDDKKEYLFYDLSEIDIEYM